MSYTANPHITDPPLFGKYAATFVAIVIRDPWFNPEHPAHEEATEWLRDQGLVREITGGPVPTKLGKAVYQLLGSLHNWPDLP
ncbi:hypothetical protein LBW56_21025 [Ralstonia solanacearum]|uniref:hypothetical protein n=1 Tax=Ralstonia solanacearum TaxID=305 RepID=UPI001FFA54FC|nr:hypothetical protein [Ralstonia solanacearum]MDB0529167.1 hypothetical protein [Ralstonia solanacearum]